MVEGVQLCCSVDAQVGARVRRRRWLVGVTLGQLSEAVGISMIELRNYENGAEQIDDKLLLRIADALNVKPDFFRGG